MENNKTNLSKELFNPVFNYIKFQKYDEALSLLDQLLERKQDPDIVNKLKASIYLTKKDWKNSLLHYQKISKSKNNFEISNNTGVAFYKLGRFSEAIDKFSETIKLKQSYVPAYSNLSVAHKLLGNFNLSTKYALNALTLNPSDNKIKNNLIEILNYYLPREDKNPILNINENLIKLNERKIHNGIIEDKLINIILDKSEEILKKSKIKFHYPETQIYRKNNTNLNCERHFGIFNKYKIIPKFCFSCYKVQITLDDVLGLLKLYFYFNDLILEKNNIRKCMIELRENVNGNYKGYIYASSLEEAKKIMYEVKNKLKNQKLSLNKIEIKHGCTEFYDEFKEYKNIDQKITDKIYKEEWSKIENIFDQKNLIHENERERIYIKTLNKYNLPDFLIIRNWLLYANIIGDESYKIIFNSKFENYSLSQDQINKIMLRKKVNLN